MEKEVAKWLHTHLGYNASADPTLSANCRGNLKTLWEFLLARYMAPENKRRIQQVLTKHRREQEAARRAPERQQEMLQQKQHLQQLERTAEALHRTLEALQVAVDSSIQDATEQPGEQALHMHELHETQSQVLLLQACMQHNQQLLPMLQAKLAKLQGILDVAQARSQATVSNRRMHTLQQQLQQATSSIRQELEEALELHFMQQQQQHPVGTDTLQPDQQGTASTHSSPSIAADSTAACKSLNSSTASWSDFKAPLSAAAGELLGLTSSSLVSGYSPSEGVKSLTLRLLQESPSLLLACCSQLAREACQELTAVLEEAEQALLSQAGSAAGSVTQQQQPQQDVSVAATGPYALPWSLPASVAHQQWQQTGMEPPELLVKQRQQLHVSLFVQAQEARAAAKAADATLTRVLGSTPLLGHEAAGSWEAQLAHLWLQAEGLRAELAVLEQRKADFEQDVTMSRQAEAALNEKWQRIEDETEQNAQMDQLLWQLFNDNMELFAALKSQQSQVMQLLHSQLGPTSRSATEAAEAGRDELQRELGVVGRLPIAALAVPQMLAEHSKSLSGGGVHLPASQHSTIARLQLAAQRLSHLGRPTTGAGAAPDSVGNEGVIAGVAGAGGSSKSACVDAAAVSALAAAAAVDATAPAKCPASLLLKVAGYHREVQQLQQQVSLLDALRSTAESTGTAGTDRVQQLRHQLHELHSQQQHEVLPRLQDQQEKLQKAFEFASQEVAADIRQLWESPAQHLLPNHKYEGKNCSEWLMEVQALHARKRELNSQSCLLL